MKHQYRRRFYLEYFLFLAGGLVIARLLLGSGMATSLDRAFYDRVLPSLPSAAAEDVVIVGVDALSLRELGPWPWDRATLAELVAALDDYGARQVLLDLLLVEADAARPESDRQLARAIAAHGNVYLPIHIRFTPGEGLPLEVLPHQRFAREARGLGHVDLEADGDGVVRQVWLREGFGQAAWDHVAIEMLGQDDMLAEAVLAPADGQARDGAPPHRAGRRYIPFLGPPGSFLQVPAADVMGRRLPPGLLRDRVVLVGGTAPGLGDSFRTPAAEKPMAGVEVNANLLQGLRYDSLARPLGHAALTLATLAPVLVTAALVPLLSPAIGLALWAAVLALVSLGAWGALAVASLWVPPGAALMGVGLILPAWHWRRLVLSRLWLGHWLARLTVPGNLRRRLGPPADLTAMTRMLDRVLPVTAWRLEHRNHRAVRYGGHQVPERAWQSARATHYSFSRGSDRYDLGILWRDDRVEPQLDRWVQAMARRVSVASSPASRLERLLEPVGRGAAEAEAGLRALERLFDASLARLEEGVVICDACGAVLYANARALLWLDLSAEQLGAVHLFDLSRGLRWRTEAGDWAASLAEALRTGFARLDCQRQDGLCLSIELSVLEVGQQPGRVLMLNLRDSGTTRRMQRVRDELMEYMSHDLRSPMISVLALVGKMREGTLDEATRQFLDVVEDSIRGNLGVTDQLLQLARVDSLERIDMDLLDMLPVVESAVGQVQGLAREKDVRVRFLYDPDEEVWVRGNHDLLERLVVNLLTNAIRYSYPGNSVDVSLDAPGERVRCEVRDRGTGMAREFLDRIFEHDGDGSRARVRGAGYGLRFVRAVAERHGGTVEAVSQPGEGSRFTLSLARHRPEELDDATV